MWLYGLVILIIIVCAILILGNEILQRRDLARRIKWRCNGMCKINLSSRFLCVECKKNRGID